MTPQIDILVVEDNPNDSRLVKRALQKTDFSPEIHIAKDGVEALEFIDNYFNENDDISLPKFILLDLKLPRLDGLELLEIIKNNKAWAHLPVIIMTSSNEAVDIERAYKLGVNSYLVKPVNFEEFYETIRELTNYWLKINLTY
ncbi:MAG: response regulator [Candidatus Stygibacter australis]|nr:response regulator [Candidatus Stygibacter australis]MDP8322221.1 response regulator [Candidatus Stygibacter australis]